MEFIKTTDQVIGVKALFDRLKDELGGNKKVLWLLSGGSAITGEAEVLQALQDAGLTADLTVMLMDERYGPVGHKDSNWEQLKQAGCDFSSFKAVPVMTEPLQSLEATAAEYAKHLTDAYSANDIIVGLFGLGPDGHTAGILPGSPAVDRTSALVMNYATPQYDRITLTRPALLRIDVAFVFAYGDAKATALQDLQAAKKSFSEAPSVLLCELPEVYIYNDQIGDLL